MECSVHIPLTALIILTLAPLLLGKENEFTYLSEEPDIDTERLTRKVNHEHPVSPCPSVFSYEGKESERDRWFGVILVTTDDLITGLRLDVKLDKTANLLGNWIGEVKSNDNIHFTILNLNQQIVPGPPLSVRIFVKFPPNENAPRLQSIKFNGRQICLQDHGSMASTSGPITQTRRPTLTSEESEKTTKQSTPDRIHSNTSADQIECGRVAVQPKPLITNGQSTARGQFPWHAALYQSKDIHLKYVCGGSLISHKTILTAAHCVMKPNVGRPVDPDALLVYLGKYHLKQWSEGGVQDKQVIQVLVHPSYNSTNYQSDIAMLILSSSVEFTMYVRPVCLWDKSKVELENIIDKEGTVAGWGYDENGEVTEELRMSKMPVVSQQTCLWSNRDFFPHFTSNMTFCAGFRNGSSVCNGDSGGGMVFPKQHKDGSMSWMLRGIVSLSKPKDNQAVCDTEHFVVFTDAAKYLGWIRLHIK